MKIDRAQIDPDAIKVIQRLRRFDHTAYLVGGCVRDLLLGCRPKDFDVATNATPQEIRRLFRNCRIIGRRFRLAHIFFGSKIIETSTFRTHPREAEEEPGEPGAGDGESQDLLIRRDNVFGSAEDDARRRDFTVNGLFYDLEAGQVIDHVNGITDLQARVVRTIGDPNIRFREDPVRILRAVKFAARCDLTIEPETYRRMLEHAGEIAKCAQSRVSEEFYRLLRAGAAERSMRLLVATSLADVLVPELAAALRQDAGEDAQARLRQQRFWAYLRALDRSTSRRGTPPSNPMVLATLLFPPLRDALHPDSNAVRDIGHLVSVSSQPMVERFRASRRDSDLARQILLAMRYLFPSAGKRRRPQLAGREFLDDALRLHEVVSDAETEDPTIAGLPLLIEGQPPGPPPDEEIPAELLASGPRRARHAVPARGPDAPPPRAPTFEGRGRTPIPDLGGVLGPTAERPRFLGTGTFGRWGLASE